ncbi:hypothetical protein [Sphingomonas yabuuchiae]|uniref:hypothetical protein n=1 Tax=Sphingomonas yabuuchiae TaxID=172044 RepID=UPI003D952763
MEYIGKIGSEYWQRSVSLTFFCRFQPKFIAGDFELDLSGTIAPHSMNAKYATKIDEVAFVLIGHPQHRERAFQASSPKNFHGLV